MPIRRLPLDQLTLVHASLVPDEDNGVNVYHVTKPHTLIQAAGYLKHKRASSGKTVYFRGQQKLYPDMKPSLYRGISRPGTRDTRNRTMQLLLAKIERERAVLRAVPQHAREAVLQHYGLRTRWLDVVDNVWVALWFACHNAHASGTKKDNLHFEKRSPRHISAEQRYAYILLLESAHMPDSEGRIGYYMDSTSVTIDLRTAVPSQFVRPHLQHGLVVQARDEDGQVSIDFSQLLAGVIRVDLEDALNWLGDGQFLNVHGLFPPPMYDAGYKEVLEHIDTTDAVLGGIHRIGA